MDLAPWLHRLDLCVPQVSGRIFGAADLAAAAGARPRVPALFVLREDERARPNERLQGPALQAVRHHVSVVAAVRNVRDPRGEAADAELLSLRQEVMAALLGWIPPDCQTPVEYAHGRRLGFDDQVLWWGDVFATGSYLEQRP